MIIIISFQDPEEAKQERQQIEEFQMTRQRKKSQEAKNSYFQNGGFVSEDNEQRKRATGNGNGRYSSHNGNGSAKGRS